MTWRAQGLRAWLAQRISAVYMLAFLLFLAASLFLMDIHSYHQWRSWMAHPFNSVTTFIFFVALLMHSWVGMRDVLIDYLHSFRLRIFTLTVLAGLLFGMGIWIARILLSSAQV